MAVSSCAHPLRCGSPPNVNQLAADKTEQLRTAAAKDRETFCIYKTVLAERTTPERMLPIARQSALSSLTLKRH
jgi:hypothetical protein